MCGIQDGMVIVCASRRLTMKERVEQDQCIICGSLLETLYHLLYGFCIGGTVVQAHEAIYYGYRLIPETCLNF